MSSRQATGAVAYLLLASFYLIYLPHTQFVLDDWLYVQRYEAAKQAGGPELWNVAVSIIENRLIFLFRFQWLSFLIGYLLCLLSHNSAAVIFLANWIVFVATAFLWQHVLEKIGCAPAVAFLSGAIFLLLPTTHEPLFWSLNCNFFVWSNFWFLLYFRSLARALVDGPLNTKSALVQAVCLIAALFSGEPVFGLLLLAAPITSWYLGSKNGLRATLLAWGTVFGTATFYALVVNRVPIRQRGLDLRYDFSLLTPWSNLADILRTYARLSGLFSSAYYRLQATWPAVLAAGIAAGVAIWSWQSRPRVVSSPWRFLALAGGLWLAAYGPVWFLRAHELRYDYTASPYLALALAAVLAALPLARAPVTAAVAAVLAAASITDMQECWIPQSRNAQVVSDALRRLKYPGDFIVMSGTPFRIGTAPDFVFTSGWASTPFAQLITGTKVVAAARDIVSEEHQLRLYNNDTMRDLGPADLARTSILLFDPIRGVSSCHLLAQEIQPDAFRLYALRGYEGPAPNYSFYTRGQLAMNEREVYFARPYSHHRHDP